MGGILSDALAFHFLGQRGEDGPVPPVAFSDASGWAAGPLSEGANMGLTPAVPPAPTSWHSASGDREVV